MVFKARWPDRVTLHRRKSRVLDRLPKSWLYDECQNKVRHCYVALLLQGVRPCSIAALNRRPDPLRPRRPLPTLGPGPDRTHREEPEIPHKGASVTSCGQTRGGELGCTPGGRVAVLGAQGHLKSSCGITYLKLICRAHQLVSRIQVFRFRRTWSPCGPPQTASMRKCSKHFTNTGRRYKDSKALEAVPDDKRVIPPKQVTPYL